MQEAFAERLRLAAVSLLRVDREPKEMFSGTLFQANGRLFVITCAHALPCSPSGKVCVIRNSGSLLSKGFPQIISAYRHPGDWPDVALLELDPQVMGTYLEGYRPIEPSDLGSLDYSISSHSVVTLVGNPTESGLFLQIGEGELIGASIVCLNHVAVPPSEWPEPLIADHPNDSGVDIYLKSAMQDEAGSQKLLGYSTPYGLSGGGIWAMTHEVGELWSSSQCKLVAVQAEWNPVAGLLRGVRIEKLRVLIPRTDRAMQADPEPAEM